MSANSTHCFGMAFPFPDTLIQFTGMSQWKTLMIYRCRITCFTIRPLQIVIYIVSQLAVSGLTVAFVSVQCIFYQLIPYVEMGEFPYSKNRRSPYRLAYHLSVVLCDI